MKAAVERALVWLMYGLVHVAVVAGVVVAAATDGWSWWLLPWVLFVLIVAVGDLCLLYGIRLDKHGQPVTGRDADRYARFRASLCSHERDEFDRITKHQDEFWR